MICTAMYAASSAKNWFGVGKKDSCFSWGCGAGRSEMGDDAVAISRSVQQMIPVIPLMWLVTEIFDEPLHVGNGHAESRARL